MLCIDLHPLVFRLGDVASTAMSHVPVRVWRLGDASDGSPVFEIAVPRSFAGDLWQLLCESAAEYGLVLTGPRDGP
jgi:sarcosine oxidase subunit gamma